MEPPRLTCNLVVEGGAALRVGPSGALIGRQHDCDVVATDPSVSRRHALVRLTRDGAELVPLGRGTIELNGKPCKAPTELGDGDAITIPGLRIVVNISAHRPKTDRVSTFRIERAAGGSFGIVHSPFVIGGEPTDDLIVKGWPSHAMVFHIAQGELLLEVTQGTVRCNGQEVTPGSLEAIAPGDQLAYLGEELTVRKTSSFDATTAVAVNAGLPRRVAIEVLPRGGRVMLVIGDREYSVFLHDRRLDLVMALLVPPAGYKAGEFIPDDTVGPIVWPRDDSVSRGEINVLIGRCRKSLVEAGLAGPRLIERAPGGGATRFALAPNAVIDVER